MRPYLPHMCMCVRAQEEQDDDDEDYAVAEQCLDRLASAVDSSIILPMFLNIIQSLLLSGGSAWKEGHAGMMAISCIAEGCHDDLLPHLPTLLQ